MSVTVAIVVPFIDTFADGTYSLLFLLTTYPEMLAFDLFWANPVIEQNNRIARAHNLFFIFSSPCKYAGLQFNAAPIQKMQ